MASDIILGSTHAGGYRLEIEWESTPNISNNTSSVTAKVYWCSLGSGYTITSSATKSGSTTIDGTSRSFTGSAALSGNQRRLVDTYTRTVNHNSNGKKSITISASYKVDIQASSWMGTVAASGTAELDDIPRASSITSNGNWTAGSNKTVNISRASSSFSHTVRYYVNGSLIKTITGVGTSTSSSFTSTQHENIFKQLNGNSSRSTRIEVDTISGGSVIGTDSVTGTCTAPSASTVNSGAASFDIGDSVSFSISRNNSSFTHTLRVYVNNTLIRTTNGINTSNTWNPGSTQISNMYNATPNSNSATVRLELDTFYGDTQVRSTTTRTGTARVTGSNPSFTNDFEYRDSNSSVISVTENNLIIVQGMSNLRVEIPSSAKAEANNGASMVRYVATFNGVERTANWSNSSTVVINFGTVSASTNSTLSIRAVDSRGNSRTANKTITIVPYSKPRITAKVERVSGFEDSTILSGTGRYSQLVISSVNKNSIQRIQYRVKLRSSSSWSDWNDITYTIEGTDILIPERLLEYDNLRAWDFQIAFQDRLSTTTMNYLIPVGKPILFINSDKNSIGINKFPKRNFSFELEGKTYFKNPNSTSGIESYVGSTDATNRDYLLLRSDSRGAGYGSGINLYPSTDSTNPNKILFYWGSNSNGNRGLEFNDNGVRLRIPNASGQFTNYLSARNAQSTGHSSSRYEMALLLETVQNRTIHLDTTGGGRLSLNISGTLRLKYPTNSTYRPQIATMTGNGREVFVFRSHNTTAVTGGALYLYSDNDSNNPGQARLYSSGTERLRAHNTGVTIYGNQNATGSKSAIVDTDSYGARKLYAVEAPDVRFQDIIEMELTNGEHWIEMNTMFSETINGYSVFHSVQGQGSLQILDKQTDKFRVDVTSENTVKVSFLIYGLRKNYEGIYMEEQKENEMY